MTEQTPVAGPGAISKVLADGLTSSAIEWPWFAVQVRSNFEKKSSEFLRLRGFEQFSPTYRCRSYWTDRTKWVDRPLFPGYIFCRFDPTSWLPVLQAPGVVRPVSFAGKPVPVEESEIVSLRVLVNSPLPLFPRAFLHVGQRIRIKFGPLTGLEGILEELGKNCRIVVSVTLLQRSVSAEIDAEWVTAL